MRYFPYQLFAGLTFWALFGFNTSVIAQTDELDLDTQGEYSGILGQDDHKEKIGLQVIANGEGKFHGVIFVGGLPGDGWNETDKIRAPETKIAEGTLELISEKGKAIIVGGIAKIEDSEGKVLGELKRVERVSSTMGAKVPAGGLQLFDGTSVDNWQFKGKPALLTPEGLLMEGANSKTKYHSHELHVEFLLPFKPHARGQERGNSGLYMQGRYEIQMLDSFGLDSQSNDCGGIYKIKVPDLNMCYPPQRWQTYDVEFHAAKYKKGKKTRNAWMKVRHNGVVIHEHVELPRTTAASPLKEGPTPGFIHLQHHNNPVRYRNIWVKEIEG